MRYMVLIVLLAVLLLPLQVLAAKSKGGLQGRVIGVHDGDTFTLLQAGNQQTKIRLAEIDAPESNQPYGNKAKQELSGLIFGKTVTVTIQDTDRYGRTVGRVTANTLDVNAEMIRRGAAWVYRKYAKDQTLYPLEAQAQQDKNAGLWNLPESQRIPPWEWRHPKNGTHLNNKHHNKHNTKPEWGRVHLWRQAGLPTNDQLRRKPAFTFSTCGLSSLDGNHDGTPCSKLCR
jgi:endonuclease YncB( thermonuclease family)